MPTSGGTLALICIHKPLPGVRFRDTPLSLNTKGCFLSSRNPNPWGFAELFSYRPLGQNNNCPLVQCTIGLFSNNLQAESSIWKKNIAIFAIPFVINMKILAFSGVYIIPEFTKYSASAYFVNIYEIALFGPLGSQVALFIDRYHARRPI